MQLELYPLPAQPVQVTALAVGLSGKQVAVSLLSPSQQHKVRRRLSSSRGRQQQEAER